jgi:hypothetical protein
MTDSKKTEAAKSEAAQTKATATKAAPRPRLQVAAKRAGFRRAGRAWPAEPTVVPIGGEDGLSEDQVAALKGEPNLFVVELPAAAAAAD